MTDRADNPYAPPASDLEGHGGPPAPLTFIEEALVDYMAAMRPWVAIFAWLSIVAAAGCAGWLFWSLSRPSGDTVVVVGCGVATAYLVVVVVALARYLVAAGVVIRSRDRRDLERALSCRRLSNVAGFALLIGGIAFGAFALGAWL